MGVVGFFLFLAGAANGVFLMLLALFLGTHGKQELQARLALAR